MIRAFVPKVYDFPVVELLYPFYKPNLKNRLIGNQTLSLIQKKPSIKIVPKLSQADICLLPHNYNYLESNPEILNGYLKTTQKSSLPLVIFDTGDTPHHINVKQAIILRRSAYRSTHTSNEVIMPALADDWYTHAKLPIHKKSLGFCGWGEYTSLKQRLGFMKQALGTRLFSDAAHLPGIIWRRRLLKLDWLQAGIATDFVIRNSYSGNRHTLSVSLKKAQKEYRHTLQSNLYQLAVRGDGNYSTRFYETLSAGRIPVLLDTDCVLPLENRIDYDSCIVKVPYRKWQQAPAIVSHHYQTLSPQRLQMMDEYARSIFNTYLRLDKYFEYMFAKRNIL